MTVLIATSVVRGSHQGESHGGVYLVDLDRERVARTIDWDTADIDWQGRGWDRGLRGIAFDGERVFIAASDELFVFAPDFTGLDSFRNPYLKHCHEIFRYKRRLYLTSTGYDSILGFDLDRNRFSWGMHIKEEEGGFRGVPFNPSEDRGPLLSNRLHLNNVVCTPAGMYVSGMRTGGMLEFDGHHIRRVAGLPQGIHNARPLNGGILFNDTQADFVRFISAAKQCSFAVPTYDPATLTHTDLDDSRTARQGFGRGLCMIDEHRVAAGSSPSTIAIHNLEHLKTEKLVTLTLDVRNAIHGLEIWPYEWH